VFQRRESSSVPLAVRKELSTRPLPFVGALVTSFGVEGPRVCFFAEVEALSKVMAGWGDKRRRRDPFPPLDYLCPPMFPFKIFPGLYEV